MYLSDLFIKFQTYNDIIVFIFMHMQLYAIKLNNIII